MVSAGNAVAFNAHPSAKRVSAETIRLLNRAIVAAGGPPNTLTTIAEPTIQSAGELMKHPLVRLLVVTGGPGVVQAAMNSGKRSICAGPGNPPAVVDATANLDQAGREMEAGRAAELMRESAKALGAPGSGRETATPGDTRSASTTSTRPTPGDRGTPAGGATGDRPGAPSALGADAARALDRVADRLDPRGAGERSASSRLSDDLARTRDLRERLDAVDRSLDALRARGGAPAPAEGQGQAPGTRGQRPGQAGAEGEIAALQRQLADQMRQAREQVDALGRSAPDMRGGGGSTPETWQPSVSAPGTEAFKQDFARWESLKRQLLVALEKVERGLADDLRQHETRDRLNAGAADAVPDDYRRLVDKYYRSLAAPRRPER
jgi:hypothetical protein